jgi:hypothetical protein
MDISNMFITSEIDGMKEPLSMTINDLKNENISLIREMERI